MTPQPTPSHPLPEPPNAGLTRRLRQAFSGRGGGTGLHTLTLRIYLTVVAVLLLFAFGSGWLFNRQMAHERARVEGVMAERAAAWGELIQNSLPEADAPPHEQAAVLNDWSRRLRMPLALDSAHGQRIATTDLYLRRQHDGAARGTAIHLEDGRTLWVLRPPRAAMGQGGRPPPLFPGWQRGVGLALLLVLLFVGVAAGAWPAVRRLTRRLQALKTGVEQFGAGQLSHRVQLSGRDEVAVVAQSFNQAAERIEALVHSHQSLLANASHELRSPLARLKMAVSMLDGAAPALRQKLQTEIDTNVAELDALVEEVLLASRLDAAHRELAREPVDLLALAAEEGARVEATVEGSATVVQGDERLLRRALRNLLENARRYGGADVAASVACANGQALVQVHDRGPGVPEALRERIFEAFYRLPGHAEQAGGVGLGLSLVRQIAQRHGGQVRCLPRAGGGSTFEMALPLGA